MLLVGMQNGAAAMEKCGSSSEKSNIELPYDPTIPLPGMDPKELKAGTQTDVCTPVFIAAWFTILKRWKQPKCPLTDEWINKM